MRFLKTKIAKAQAFKKLDVITKVEIVIKKEEFENCGTTASSGHSSPHEPSSPHHKQYRITKTAKPSENFITPLKTRASKSIVKNYGKAICSFACSDLAKPYLETLVEKHDVSYDEFLNFMTNAKNSIDSLQAFQSLLLIKETDSVKMTAFKKIFMAIGEVFINYFSVNWIFSGRIVHKEAHLKARFKMMRRIRNPQFFTYLK